MAMQKEDSVDIEDADFQAFLNESLSDDETATNKGSAAKFGGESGETSMWWAEDTNKESSEMKPSGIRRSSFMKTSSLLSDDFAAKRQAESLAIATSDSTIHEENFVEPVNTGAKQVEVIVPAEVMEEPETSVQSSHDTSDPLLHSTLLKELQQSEPGESADVGASSDAVETKARQEGELQKTVDSQDQSVAPTAVGAHSNLLSQVQLSDTGSLDLTLQSKVLSSAVRAYQQKDIASPSVYPRPIDSSITELDEDHTSETTASKRPISEPSGSASAVDKKAVINAMSTLISEQVAGSADVRHDEGASETTNSKTMPELIAEMEALDNRPQSPPTLSTDRTQSGSIQFTKSPYRPSSSQRTARVRSAGIRSDSVVKRASPSSTRSQSKIPIYSHVRSSGYGLPSYMPQLSQKSGISSLSSTARLSKHFLGLSRASDQYGSTLGSQTKEQFYGSASGEAFFKQKVSAPLPHPKNMATQTIPETESKKEVEQWHRLFSESSREVNELRKRLDETERSFQISQDRCQQANETLARLRKTYAAKAAAPAPEEQHGVAELERMLTAYQRDNEKMRIRLKDVEKENQRLAEAPPEELAHLMEMVEELRQLNGELRNEVSEKSQQFEVEMKRLGEELKQARIAEADSELRAAQQAELVATLEREKAHFAVEIQSLRDQISENVATKPDKMSKTVSISKQTPKRTSAPPKTETKDDSVEISRLRNALSSAENELEKLRLMQQQEAMKPPPVFDSQSRKLELAVRELESLLREKHPNSVPVAVLDVAAEEAAVNSEKIRQLEDRCRRLEGGNHLKMVPISFEKATQADFVLPVSNEKSYSAAVFADSSAVDDRIDILKRHIAEQEMIMARLRNETNELKTVQLADKAEIVRLKGALVIFERQNAEKLPQANRQEEIIQTLLRERAVSLKTETKLKAELFESGRRLEIFETRVRELMDQLADARSNHTPERRLFDRLLDRLAELERRFARREEVIRELRTATTFGQPIVPNGTVSSAHLPLNVDPNFLRTELDKLVQELHDLRSRTVVDSLQKGAFHTSMS